ncbi:helix-turn-helix transcriptional regulator [Streptomyces sp. NPDC004111]|uniref:helix-turn-helix transcriptional regulator n=1 Tax=Streptomyces sp. NPDC004111 TaxID=3364690 RepID=UPI00368D12C7
MDNTETETEAGAVVSLATIARRLGVGYPAVANWRRRHPDFPPPVHGAGTQESPRFRAEEVDAWVRAHGKHPTGHPVVTCHCGTAPTGTATTGTPTTGRPTTGSASVPSPLVAADRARHAGDLVGEIGALTGGAARLESAPWAPTRAGDVLVVTYEAHEGTGPFTETYEVFAGSAPWPDATELRLVAHTAPDADLAGWFAGVQDAPDADVIESAWMEAGPARLAVLRHGYVLHQGRHAQLPPRDVDAIAAASRYVKHGTAPAGGAYPGCVCPKEPCGGVTTPQAGCPEHDREPVQLWHWAAECPAKGA